MVVLRCQLRRPTRVGHAGLSQPAPVTVVPVSVLVDQGDHCPEQVLEIGVEPAVEDGVGDDGGHGEEVDGGEPHEALLAVQEGDVEEDAAVDLAH